MTSNGPSSTEQLRLFIERLERLEADKKGIADDIKDVKAEAKSAGFDVKTIVSIMKLRAMDPQERREREALLDTYKAALGMLDGTPLGRWAVERLEREHERKDDAPPPGDTPDPETPPDAGGENGEDDALYRAAVDLVVAEGKAPVSFIQRKLSIGYNKASAIVERMEREGIVSAPDETGRRTVLRTPPSSPGADAEPPQDAPVSLEDAKIMGREAARAGKPVTANPFPPRDERRAAWDEAWCSELGSDGMDIPLALRPAPKSKKADAPASGRGDEPGAGE
ncbi:MAG: DUF2312 domain-containing protein [Sphingomonadaceae bacterium]|nr:DUF2312 domain-containing protein [Sphingomonadaceae bacterium]